MAGDGEGLVTHPPIALSEAIKALPPAALAGAASKLVAASVGDVAVVFSRSPAHKHYALADIEWMVLPAVLHGQFYVAVAIDRASGFRAPIAVVTWAFVSEEVDRRLSADLSHHIRLRPDEWKCGDIAWIVDLAGAPAGMRYALQWLKAGPFKDKEAKLVVRDSSGAPQAVTLDKLMSAADGMERKQ
jgi:cytolysin-activating lysine-acyltransferase